MHTAWVLKQKGFTIVELLIVIVVIGILAAITIVAFNGIQDRARTASLQSDTTNAGKTLETFRLDPANNNLYPANLAAANLKASSGNTPTYTSYNSQQGYCAQFANGTTNYFTYAGGQTKEGTCTPLTNMITNPSFETNTTGWAAYNATIGVSTAQAHSGSQSLRVVPSTSATYSGVGFTSPPGANGTQYRFSAYVYSESNQNINFAADALNANTGPVVGPSWQRISVTGTRTNGNALYIRAISASGVPFYVDSVMFTQGGTLYPYADGSTDPNWSWTGTAHGTTSTGIAL